MRGATIAVLAVPVTLVALVVTGLLVGWPIAAWHTAFVAGMVVTLVELAVLSLDRVPFTRPYAAGDGLLRTRWPLYLFGMFAFVDWPCGSSCSCSAVASPGSWQVRQVPRVSAISSDAHGRAAGR